MNSRGDLRIIIVAGIIILIIILIIVAFFSGRASATKVEFANYESHDCSNKLGILSNEYGVFSEKDGFFLNGNDFYLIDFNSEWIVPFSGATCRINEDGPIAQEIFKIGRFKRNIEGYPEDFFSRTRDCFNVSVAKGMENICNVSGIGTTILDLPITQVMATIPIKSTEDAVKTMTKNDWIALAAKDTATVFKKIKSSNITVVLTFVNDTSCTLKDTPKLTVWHVSDYANQLFLKAKKNEFYTDTIPKLAAISETIISMEKVKFSYDLPEYQQPKTAFDLVAFLIKLFSDAVGIFIRTMSEAVTDVITVISDPTCDSQKQITKFEPFRDITIDQNYLTDYDEFVTALNQYKSQAKTAIELRNKAKEENAPGRKWITLPIKSINYYTIKTNAENSYSEQLYITTKREANQETTQYQNYWKEITWMDGLQSAIIWGLIITLIILLIIKTFYWIKPPQQQIKND